MGHPRHKHRAGLWVAGLTRLAVTYRDTAETADLDALAVGQGVSYLLQQPIDRRRDILLRHVVVGTDESFDELRLGHTGVPNPSLTPQIISLLRSSAYSGKNWSVALHS